MINMWGDKNVLTLCTRYGLNVLGQDEMKFHVYEIRALRMMINGFSGVG